MKTMKTFLPIILSLLLSFMIQAQNKFMPGPDANLQTLPAGSYVIPMGNTLQTNTAGYFNLKSYGLICHLLNNNVKLKWVVRAGKAKDGIDFSALAEQFQPDLTISLLRDFKAGPFVISAEDTTGVAALINSFYTVNVLTGNNRPRVYRLTAPAVNVDIRHDMSGFRPKVAILDDGKNTDIHLTYMTLCSIPNYNYTTGLGGIDLLTKCFTFASEPHNDASSPATIAAIKKFVQYGGNFLAQCRAVEAYENSAEGRFQTTGGIDVTNTNVNSSLTVYPNPDLTFTQFEGVFSINKTGSVKNWNLASGSSFINNEHNHATGGTIGAQGPIGASVSKLTSSALAGGMVFFLGNHSFDAVNDIEDINGIRMYMNAMLTPNTININCNTGENRAFPLPVKLMSFGASLKNENAELTWKTSSEINTNHFIIERSTDGKNYHSEVLVFAKGNSAEINNYSFTDKLSTEFEGLIYYRLKLVDVDGNSLYSDVRILRIGKSTGNAITILTYPNPATSEVRITIPGNWQNKKVVYELYNASGTISKRKETANSSQTETISLSSLAPGFYIIRANCEGEVAQQKIVKN
jgi:hypothetical protein